MYTSGLMSSTFAEKIDALVFFSLFSLCRPCARFPGKTALCPLEMNKKGLATSTVAGVTA